MNKDILRAAGFGEEVDLVNEGKCPFCKQKVNPDDFRDSRSKKEHEISGLCQKCQDETFGK